MSLSVRHFSEANSSKLRASAHHARSMPLYWQRELARPGAGLSGSIFEPSI